MKSTVVGVMFFIFTLWVVLLSSCKEENLEPGVPAFIHVEHFDFSTYYGIQGTNRQKITDVWVFADGATIGVFELPVTIPILKNGIGELRMEPGIELNGISTTRVNNPFFEPVVIDDFNFIPDSIVDISPSSTYRESTVFVWMEDFEDPSVSLDTTNLQSSVNIERIGGEDAFEGSYSGIVILDDDHTTFEAATFDSYAFEGSGGVVLLEMNYKNTYYFSVGIIEQSTSQIIKSEILILNPSDEWNKIYINFTDKIRASSASSFKVLFRTYIPGDGTEAVIMLDNLKLLYR